MHLRDTNLIRCRQKEKREKWMSHCFDHKVREGVQKKRGGASRIWMNYTSQYLGSGIKKGKEIKEASRGKKKK